MSKVIDEVVFKKAITEVLQVVADNTFDFVEYDDDSINALFDVESPEKLAYYESLINPDLVSENRLWSSKTIADKIAESILQANEYSDDLIKNISSIQLEWCSTSLPVTGETNKIYILPVTSGSDTVNTLNIWNSKTSAYVSIGNLEIDLSQYYTKSEMDTKLNDKANSSEVLSQDGVLTTTGSETNDTVYSSKLTKDELDKKANDDEVVKKTDITTKINSSSTDDKIPSAKSVYNSTKYSTIGLDCPLDKSPLEFILENRNIDTILYFSSWGNNTGDAPDQWASYIGIKHKDSERISLISISSTGNYRINSYQAGVWSGWKRVCTTSVADVPVTGITNFSSNYTSGTVSYMVKNGICYVSVSALKLTTTGTGLHVCDNMPIPALGHSDVLAEYAGVVVGNIMINADGELQSHYVDSSKSLYCTFSYPVAE